MAATGLVMHIDDDLEFTKRRELEETIEHEQGVMSAHFNERRPHLMVVEYDPHLVSHSQIVGKVNSSSVHAERIA